MNNLPFYLNAFFILTSLLAVFFFYRAARNSNKTLFIIVGWFLLQGIIGFNGFYQETTTMPPRFLLLVGPPFLMMLLLLLTKKGKRFSDNLDPTFLTYLHLVRLPVEITLFFLFLHKEIPQLMTFEGRNFDILAGISAPLIAYLFYQRKKINPKLVLIWNSICLGLVLNIMIHGILSVPYPFQQFGFEQPNIGVLKFPFVWLPGFIVPVVIYAHITSMRLLFKNELNQKSKHQ